MKQVLCPGRNTDQREKCTPPAFAQSNWRGTGRNARLSRTKAVLTSLLEAVVVIPGLVAEDVGPDGLIHPQAKPEMIDLRHEGLQDFLLHPNGAGV